MPIEVKTTLKALAEAMDCQMEGYSAYLNVETGEIVEVSDEDLGKVEMGEEPEWSEDEDLLREIIERPEVYRALPSKYDIHEYNIMRDFAHAQEGRLRDDLLRAISGRGAFRYFKDTIHRYGVAERWYAFKEEVLKEMAREWCEKEGLVINGDSD